ncbi:hypothetical protein BVRB_6g143550 [Beta vulgaris subsp. vulgaris]|nr:hypothetical protein BVRB_6g143550 [Beta vulgaris subsp. vulgaris]
MKTIFRRHLRWIWQRMAGDVDSSTTVVMIEIARLGGRSRKAEFILLFM